MPLLKFTRNRDQTYGPTTNGKYYISKPDHRKNSRSGGQKTKWCIDEDQEFSVFKPACEDFNSWFCRKNNCIFAVVDNGQITLGKSGEKLAKFPNVSNGTDPWHGYPVLTENEQNRPSSDMLLQLKEKLPVHLIVKIERGTL